MRGSVRREVVVGVDADTAWRVAGRPDLLHHWYPGVVACQVAGDVRTVTLATGLTFEETILTCDPLLRRFQEVVAPGDRIPQRPLPRRRVPAPDNQERQPPLQPA